MACEQSSLKHGLLSAISIWILEVYAVGAVSNNGDLTTICHIFFFHSFPAGEYVMKCLGSVTFVCSFLCSSVLVLEKPESNKCSLGF